MKNNEGIKYFVAAGALLAAMLFIFFIASPFSKNDKKADDTEQTVETSSGNDGISLNETEKETQAGVTVNSIPYDEKRGTAASELVDSIFNVGYRNITADLDSFVNRFMEHSDPEVTIWSNPETGESYEFDVNKGKYTNEEFAKLFADWVVKNQAEIEASFEPSEEFEDIPGLFYYVKGTLKLNVHACEDTSYLAQYFLLDKIELNTEYEIPVEIEVIHDYDTDTYLSGTLLRETEFYENWTPVLSEDDGVIEPY